MTRVLERVRRPRRDLDADWLVADLAERVEKAEADLSEARENVARLETELLVARLWVKELALWLEEAQARTGGAALPATRPKPEELVLSPETLQILEDARAEPTPWRKLAVLAALMIAPWALAAIALLTWTLV